MYNIIRGLLKQKHKVKVLCLSTPKLPVDISDIPEAFREETAFESFYLNTNPTFSGALTNLFSRKSYHLDRFYNKNLEERIGIIVNQGSYDIIQLESLYMAPYIDIVRKNTAAPLVMRAHNIEHIIWQRMASGEKNILKKKYLELQSRRLKKYEFQYINACDGIAVITDVDAAYLKSHEFHKPVCTIPFGIDVSDTSMEQSTERAHNSIFSLGSLNWMPNIEGLDWFIDNVWQKIHAENKNITFYIAGRHTPERLRNLNLPNIKVVGEVDDALAYMRSKEIMVVPLLSGSGMRVKIIEGMFAGNTIISTTTGAEGIDCTHEQNIVLADDPDTFAQAVLKYAANKDLCHNIGTNAHRLIKEKYINDDIIKKLIGFYDELTPQK